MAVKYDDLLQQIPNQDLRGVLAKADEATKKVLESAFMMQSDYNRQLDGIRNDMAELKILRDKADQWKKFYESGDQKEWARRYNEFPTLQSQIQQKEAELAAKEAELEAVRANAAGENIDFSKLEDGLSKKLGNNYVSAESAKKMIEDAVANAVATSNRHTEGVIGTYNDLLQFSQKAMTELGEAIDPKVLAEEAQRTGNVQVAFDNLTRDRYKAREIEAAVKKAEEAAYQKGISEALGRVRTEDTTGSMGPSADMGHFESALKPEHKQISEIPPDYELGQGAIGRLAGDEYVKLAAEGKLT